MTTCFESSLKLLAVGVKTPFIVYRVSFPPLTAASRKDESFGEGSVLGKGIPAAPFLPLSCLAVSLLSQVLAKQLRR